MSDVNYSGTVRSGRWQDWCNLVLAVWLFISPWVLGFATGGNAAGVPATSGFNLAYPSWNAWVFGVIVAIVAISAMFSFRSWQEWINLLIGIWLFVAPWVLHFSAMGNPAWDHWIVGVIVFLIALSALSNARGASVAYTHAGQKPMGTAYRTDLGRTPPADMTRTPSDLNRNPNERL